MKRSFHYDFDMSRLLRITLTWLLALALPMQGYAAQATLVRGLAHQASMMASSHPTHAHHDTAGATSQQDADCCDEEGAESPTHGGSTHAKCSGCSSGCGAVAIATPTFTIEVSSHGMTMVAAVAVANGHFVTGGIDRPPRPSLA